MQQNKVIQELEEKLKHNGYTSDYFAEHGIHGLFVGEGTLGPEMSWVAQHLTEYLIAHPELYKGKSVLDMGSGSGVQAVTVALYGAASVLAVDISSHAIESIKENIRRFRLRNVEYLQSDLFRKIKQQRFHVIIFNHPFFTGQPKEEIERIYRAKASMLNDFFHQAKDYLTTEGVLIMPFSHFGDHDPQQYAKAFHYSVLEEIQVRNGFGDHSIYLLSSKNKVQNKQSTYEITK